MKKQMPILILFQIWIGARGLSAQTMTFVHPGAANNKADLDFVKTKIAASEQPWIGQFNQMVVLATSYTENTVPLDGNENGQKEDARKAYANALAWYYTRNTTYAQNAIAVLNVWGNTFNGYAQAGQSQLNAAWIGTLLGPAAEIMRGYSGWQSADMTNVQNMFKTRFYSVLNRNPIWNNGNIDLTMADALLNIAVFCDDAVAFNAGVAKLNECLRESENFNNSQCKQYV